MTSFAAPIAEQIWDMKYRFKEADGTPLDATIQDSWHRIAGALASVEKDPVFWEQKFFSNFCQPAGSRPVPEPRAR
jgi:ribonucleoside-diphosphate reductase alpha chain